MKPGGVIEAVGADAAEAVDVGMLGAESKAGGGKMASAGEATILVEAGGVEMVWTGTDDPEMVWTGTDDPEMVWTDADDEAGAGAGAVGADVGVDVGAEAGMIGVEAGVSVDVGAKAKVVVGAEAGADE